LQRKEGKGTLTKQEELELILSMLEEEDVHVRTRAEYTTDSRGDRNGRVIKDLFWMSPEQIRMARRFASGFMYETDATFNTNCLKLLLSVIVGIDNCGKTFPIAFCYITSKSAASFRFVANQLTNLAFYDCPKPAVIVGDFSKGLRAACAAKAALDLSLTEIIEEPLVCPPEQDEEILEAAQVVVYEELGSPQTVSLQLCEWHAVQAIKKRLVSSLKLLYNCKNT
jgi:MULE transposase domain